MGSDALYQEWGYTAMTRGREANHLYVVGAGAGEREEWAPADAAPSDDRERLLRALAESRGQMLALDAGAVCRIGAAVQPPE